MEKHPAAATPMAGDAAKMLEDKSRVDTTATNRIKGRCDERNIANDRRKSLPNEVIVRLYVRGDTRGQYV
jgi:hypothetical protein